MLVADAFDSNWIAPLGPHVDAFEHEFAVAVGAPHAVALASGTAALHLALITAGIGAGDEVAVSTLTFAASVFPIRYVGAVPVLIDCDPVSWNLDAGLFIEFLEARARRNRLPRALILVHLYGQCADIDPIADACQRHGVHLIEDAAEALGASYRGRHPGTTGESGVFSFNGNKIITTSGGGMLVTSNADAAAHARKLATQAREPAPHYEHREVGFNYRLSNLCAAVGRAQLAKLEARVGARRAIFERYREGLGDLPGITLAPEVPWGRHTRWLSCIQVDSATFGSDREAICEALAAEDIEARPVWKPMHLQPIFAGCERVGGHIATGLFRHGLCLPSGSNLDPRDQQRVIEHVRDCHRARA